VRVETAGVGVAITESEVRELVIIGASAVKYQNGYSAGVGADQSPVLRKLLLAHQA
jgi:hypothetical protein